MIDLREYAQAAKAIGSTRDSHQLFPSLSVFADEPTNLGMAMVFLDEFSRAKKSWMQSNS